MSIYIHVHYCRASSVLHIDMISRIHRDAMPTLSRSTEDSGLQGTALELRLTGRAAA